MKDKAKTKPAIKTFIAGARITPEESEVIRAYQQREGLRNFSEALRTIIIDRSGLFDSQQQSIQT